MAFWLLMTCLLGNAALDDCKSGSLGLMLKAQYASLVGNYAKALDMADQAMECSPLASDAAYLKITILGERERERLIPSDSQRELVDNLTEYMERYPEDYRFIRKLGIQVVKNPGWVVTHNLKDPGEYLKKALKLMEPQAEELNDEIADTWYHLGRWNLVNFEPFEAAEAFSRVCRLDPSSTWAWYYAGKAYEGSHQLRKALASYKQFNLLVVDEPWNRKPAVDANIALLELLLDPSDENMVAFWDLLKADRAGPEEIYSAAMRLEKMQEYGRALELLESIESKERNFDFYILFSRIHLAMGRYQDWLQKAMTTLDQTVSERTRLLLIDTALDAAILGGSWERVMELNDTYGEVPQLRGRLSIFAALLSILERDDSSYWEQLKKQTPDDPVIRFWSAQIREFGLTNTAHRAVVLSYMGQEDWEKSYQYLAVITDLDNPEPAFVEELAMICALTDRKESGFRLYHQLVEAHPDRIDLLNNYGYFLAEAGQELTKAHNMLVRVLKTESNNTAHMDSMGWILFRMGKLDEARRWIAKAIRLKEDDPEQLEHMGDILNALGRNHEARKYWSKAMEHTNDRYPDLFLKLEPEE